jgi:hypothetical protein
MGARLVEDISPAALQELERTLETRHQSASGVDPYVVTSRSHRATRRRPQSSSIHTTADRARSDVNNDAFAAKYDSMSPWKSR